MSRKHRSRDIQQDHDRRLARQEAMWRLYESNPDSVQCWLRRGAARQMVWIPEEHAVMGRFLRLTEHTGASEDGWEVISIGARQPEEPRSYER